jgi:hypothetical protein
MKKNLQENMKPFGMHPPYPSGVYFIRMQAGQFNETRKLILMK